MEQPAQTKAGKNIRKITHIFEFVVKVRWFISALAALVLFFIVKRYAYDIVLVNNHDMEPGLSKGDAVLVKKILNTYTREDILYFEYPAEDSSLRRCSFMQRVIGLAGDCVQVHNKQVFVNTEPIHDSLYVKHNYFIKLKHAGGKSDSSLFSTYGLWEGGEISIDHDYSYALSHQEFAALKKDSLIHTITLKIEKEKDFDETCFPYEPEFPWNMDFYGKIYIPKKNDTLPLDSLHLKLYTSLIVNYERNHLEKKHDSIFINGQYTQTYQVKKNYYFVLGDNRDNANDSRVWGLLPENYIRGKVIGIIRSVK